METNEVQWHPPEQFLSAAPEVVTTSDDKLDVPVQGEEEGIQNYQDDEDDSKAKGDFP